MITEQDVEGYLIRMGVSFEQIGQRTWMIRDNEEAVDNLVVLLNDPVIVFSVKLADIPEGCDRLKLYEELLRLNAREMLHGAYGLEGNAIIATDTLQSEHLDFNEFQASVDALNLCITSHYRHLQPFLRPPARPRSA